MQAQRLPRALKIPDSISERPRYALPRVMILSQSSVASLVLSPDKMLGASAGVSQPPGAPAHWEDEMNFVMQRVEYDRHKERAYVEFRGPDQDGGDAITVALFSYRTTEQLSKKQLHAEIVRKARYLLKRSAVAT
jgi:hypothetical protein